MTIRNNLKFSHIGLAAAVTVAALVAGACGGSDRDSNAVETPIGASAATTVVEPSATVPAQTEHPCDTGEGETEGNYCLVDGQWWAYVGSGHWVESDGPPATTTTTVAEPETPAEPETEPAVEQPSGSASEHACIGDVCVPRDVAVAVIDALEEHEHPETEPGDLSEPGDEPDAATPTTTMVHEPETPAEPETPSTTVPEPTTTTEPPAPTTTTEPPSDRPYAGVEPTGNTIYLVRDPDSYFRSCVEFGEDDDAVDDDTGCITWYEPVRIEVGDVTVVPYNPDYPAIVRELDPRERRHTDVLTDTEYQRYILRECGLHAIDRYPYSTSAWKNLSTGEFIVSVGGSAGGDPC